ncbi:hypothetical protein GCM10007285_31260 [Stappia taiwanensis]|nr:hypothetical protein GCM10007285_31260 [Stappia taiwanensis]
MPGADPQARRPAAFGHPTFDTGCVEVRLSVEVTPENQDPLAGASVSFAWRVRKAPRVDRTRAPP